MMKNTLVLLLCAVIGSACTTLHPVQLSTNNAQQQITSGQLLKPGDKVRLITTDGEVHDFAITAIDTADGTVKGAANSVRVADIVTVEKREPALGKTLGLTLGIVGALQLGAGIRDASPPWAPQ
jgi:hypothetical protein